MLFAETVLVDLLAVSLGDLRPGKGQLHLRNDVIDYLPANAGSQILITVPTRSVLGPWTGLGVLSAYALIALGAATVLITHRDV